MSDVIIVGGGVIGLTTAWELASRNLQVTVLDQSEMGQEASWAGAGMIPPGDLLDPATHQLAVLSAQLWPDLSARLYEQTGIDNGYRLCGGLVLPTHENVAAIQSAWQSHGVPAEIIDEPALQALEPALAPHLTSAVSLPTLSQVRNPRHLKALKAACLAAGVQLLPQQGVVGWEMDGARILAAQTDKGRVTGDKFIVTAGAWSAQLLEQVGLDLAIRPMRGQMLLLHAPQQIIHRVIESGPRYLVPRDDGRILIGSTEEDVGFQKTNTDEAIAALRQLGVELVPSLADVPVEKTWAGLRPFATRRRPFLGKVPDRKNLYIAAGHFRAGLSNSPATALLLRQLILQEPLTLDLADFGC
ncbi:glycine oxidase ThiO [Planctomicrobium piriforme]|uniref:Glycine oxidase n=1 Tax=Planctomicrobium piriforme TaxID=1576369 RepID=A0A1I3G0S3_9PLAN|nr:glycine oxidase ThiO [Planctomicrobium piriforme]SFI17063.1 glycine oxidase [Planctomicrobium piriforme]